MLLEEMEARAQRHLDGTRVNVDAMAREVLTLVAAVRRARAALATRHKTDHAGASEASFEKAFGSLFGDIFGGR